MPDFGYPPLYMFVYRCVFVFLHISALLVQGFGLPCCAFCVFLAILGMCSFHFFLSLPSSIREKNSALYLLSHSLVLTTIVVDGCSLVLRALFTAGLYLRLTGG